MLVTINRACKTTGLPPLSILAACFADKVRHKTDRNGNIHRVSLESARKWAKEIWR